MFALKIRNKVLERQNVYNILSYFIAIGSFCLIDVWLRVVTRWINAYSIYSIEPNLFTLLWAVFWTALLNIPSRKIGGVMYGVLYFVFLTYAVIQYGAYLILGKFLFISDFLYAGEGMDYISYATRFLTPWLAFQVLFLICLGIIGIAFFRKSERGMHIRKKAVYDILMAVVCLIGIANIPVLYGKASGEEEWDNFFDAASEYERFVNANFDLELTGMYQYFARDLQIQMTRQEGSIDIEDVKEIDSFFEKKPDHTKNTMTGVFKDKNLIVVMMESTDDWLINKEDTPTLYYMMENGINFT